MVAAEPKERTTVHLTASVRREVDKKAEAAGQTLSMWVERALKAQLEAGDS